MQSQNPSIFMTELAFTRNASVKEDCEFPLQSKGSLELPALVNAS